MKWFASPVLGLLFESVLFHAARQRDGARPLAFTFGVFALCFVLVELITADSLQRPVHWRAVWIGAYIGISHVLYSIVGREGSGFQESVIIIEKDKPGDDPADWWKRSGGRPL